MFKGKETKVALIGDAKIVYLELVNRVRIETNNGKKGTEHQKILKSITRKISELKKNPQAGIHIKKNQIPKYYIERYEVENLWKCDLADFWRMIYWIDGSNKVEIVSFILDIIDHELYNKRFGYKSN